MALLHAKSTVVLQASADSLQLKTLSIAILAAKWTSKDPGKASMRRTSRFPPASIEAAGHITNLAHIISTLVTLSPRPLVTWLRAPFLGIKEEKILEKDGDVVVLVV
jgi:hypothetical protein